MDKFLYGCIYLSAAIAVSVLLMIICYVTVRGIGSVSLEFLTTVTSARKGTVGIAGNIVNTLYIIRDHAGDRNADRCGKCHLSE